LSGGAARGLAHAGVYRYLLEKGLEVAAVAGSSAGAVVGAFAAAGYSPEEMVSLALSVKPLSVFRPQIPPKRSLFKNEPVLEFFRRHLPERFEELEVPFFVSATDLLSGEAVVLSEGPLPEAVMASAALPPFFEPVELGGRLLNDGGFSNDLPVEPLLKRDCFRVCVDVTPLEPTDAPGNWAEITLRTFLIAVRAHKAAKYPLCDLLIVPELKGLGFLNYKRVKEYVEVGYRAAEKAFGQLLSNS